MLNRQYRKLKSVMNVLAKQQNITFQSPLKRLKIEIYFLKMKKYLILKLQKL